MQQPPRTSRLALGTLLGFAALVAACSTGLGGFPFGGTAQPVAEPSPASTQGFVLAPQVALVDPGSGQPVQPVGTTTSVSVLPGFGPTAFAVYATSAAADDADGLGTPLDLEAPPDTNGVLDVFATVGDADGNVLDTVLVSQTTAGAAANAVSEKPAFVFAPNLEFDPQNTAGTNPAGWLMVAFESDATDLVAPDGNGFRDVFREAVQVNVDQNPVTGAAEPGSLNLSFVSFGGWIASQNSSFAAANGSSGNASIALNTAGNLAAGGTFIAFETTATNLNTFNDANGPLPDVWIKEIPPFVPANHTSNPSCLNCHSWYWDTFLASGDVVGNGGNAGSYRPRLAHGLDTNGEQVQAVVFESDSTNLVAADTNGVRDVFYKLIVGQVDGPPARASVASGGLQGSGGASGNADVHLVDADAGDVLVAFESAKTDLVAELPPNTTTSVYLYTNQGSERTALLNARSGPAGAIPGRAAGGSAAADSFRPSFSGDGSVVAFETLADDLDLFRPRDRNGASDVVLADLTHFLSEGTLRHFRVSVTASGQDADGASTGGGYGAFQGSGTVTLGARGQPIAFAEAIANKMMHPRCVNCHGINSPSPTSPGSTLPNHSVGQDCNGCHLQAFTGVADWRAPGAALDFRGKTVAELCRIAIEARPTPKDHLELDPRIVWAFNNGLIPEGTNGDSKLAAGGVVPGAAVWFDQVEDWVDGGMVCSDIGASGGEFVTFATQAANLGAASGEAAFVGFVERRTSERVSKTTGFPPAGGRQLQGASSGASLSPDDRYAAFETEAALLPQDTNGTSDVYVRDLFLGKTVLVSHANARTAAANGASGRPAITVAGTDVYVAFESTATNLVGGFVDGNGPAPDVYLSKVVVENGLLSPVQLVSRRDGQPTTGGDGASRHPDVGVGAQVVVVFESEAGDLLAGFVDHNGIGSDVFRFQQPVAGPPSTLSLVSRGAAGGSQGGDGSARAPSVDASGAYAAFESEAGDHLPGFVDNNGAEPDAFVADLAAGTVALASHRPGSSVQGGNGASRAPSAGGSGSWLVAFESLAGDLVAGFVDNNGPTGSDVFLVPQGGGAELVSAAHAGGGGGDSSFEAELGSSTDVVAFASLADDLVDPAGDPDTNAEADVFTRHRTALETRRRSLGPSRVQADGASTHPSLGSGVGPIVFDSLAGNLAGPGTDTNAVSDVYRADP